MKNPKEDENVRMYVGPPQDNKTLNNREFH